MPHRPRFRSLLLTCLGILAASGITHAANFSAPRMELSTWGRMQDGDFGLFSRAYVELLLEGGDKFRGRTEFTFQDNHLEDSRPLPPAYDADELQWTLQKNLRFKSISVEMKKLFGGPINLEYFTGATDIFASGSDFLRSFDTDDFTSAVTGYEYFPQGVIYEGLHAVNGTGLKLRAPGLAGCFDLSLYTYQDAYFPKGRYSSDFRLLYNAESLKIETFFGATYPSPPYGLYRGGLMFFVSTGVGGEFFAQIGIPRWDPDTDADFAAELFYLLFEPRVRVDRFSVILTFFWHPLYYRQAATMEEGTLDFFVKFMYGDHRKKGIRGGLENKLGLQTRTRDEYHVQVSPFLSFLTSGVAWDLKLNIQLQPFALDELIQTYIGIKTQL